jgi:hydroxypyruvate reductase
MIRNRDALVRREEHDDALACLTAAIDAAHPERVVRETVTVSDGTLSVGDRRWDLGAAGRVVVGGGGNAAGTAASALEAVLGEFLDEGAVVTDDPASTETIEMLSGSHPVPSQTGAEHTRRVLELAESAGEDDVVIALVTGGGSALLAAPAEGVALSDVQSLTDALLQSGADIGEINTIRKHLSQVKGGQLAAAAAPATVVGLVFSDVVGNDLATVASGPTAPDDTTYAGALAVLDRYDVDAPAAVREHLEAGAAGDCEETPAADSAVFECVSNHVLADNLTAVEAAAETARERGYRPLILSSRIRGEAREAAETHAAIAEEARASGNPADPPVALLSGGETTVTDPGDGSGGPNQEFALAVAVGLDDPDTVFAAVDTDGIDGATETAGALVDHRTVTDRQEALAALAGHDSRPFLAARDAVIETGQTGTNVNDLRVHLVAAEDAGE